MKDIILIIFFLLQSDWEQARPVDPILFKENIKLKSYMVSKSFKLNQFEYILIAKNSPQSIENEGYRMLYIRMDSSSESHVTKYVSKPKGEAYVYNPYFFEFLDGEKLIIVEEGYEYMSGIDIYRLRNGEIDFLGYVPVSGPNRDSVIEHIKIEKKKYDYKLSFSGQIEYEVATDNIINGSTLSVAIINDQLSVK